MNTKLTLSLALLSLTACPGTGSGGKTPDENAGDIRVLDAGASARNPDDYAYVTERPLAIVALAEARGIPDALAKSAIDGIADRLDVCATSQAGAGKLVDGAARVIAVVDAGGVVHVASDNVTIDPQAAVGNALLCLIAPLKQMTFPPTSSTAQRALAIESMWGRGIPHSKPAHPAAAPARPASN